MVWKNLVKISKRNDTICKFNVKVSNRGNISKHFQKIFFLLQINNTEYI